MIFCCRTACVLFAALFLALTPQGMASAQSASDFYRSQQKIVIVAPSAAGGGYDSYARLVGRYMSKYIPGQPSTVVVNMPGGGGIVAANYIYNVAPKDGPTLAILDRGTPTAPLLYGDDSKALFDARKFSWIGSAMSETGMGVVAARAPATTIEGARKTEIFFGATGPETDPSMNVRLVNALLGTKIRAINGYKGQPEQFLALEKGEIHGLFMSGWSGPGRAYVRQHVKTGDVKIFLQMTAHPDPQDGDAPTILDVVKPEDRPIVDLVLGRLALGRPFVAPPLVASDRVELLRTAFQQAMQDPELLAEADAQKLAINPTWGAPAQALMIKLYEASPALLERVRKIVRITN